VITQEPARVTHAGKKVVNSIHVNDVATPRLLPTFLFLTIEVYS